MFWIVESLIIGFFTLNFIRREKPNITFLCLGFLFSIVAFVFKIPLLLALNYLSLDPSLTSMIISAGLFAIISAVISEITRYLSLKRFLTTRSYKNGVLFGIGWATFDVVVFFQNMVLNFFILQFSFLSEMTLETLSFSLLDFSLLFTTTLVQSVFIIFAIINKKKRFIIYSIVYALMVFVFTDISPLSLFSQEISAKLLVIALNLVIFFNYRALR